MPIQSGDIKLVASQVMNDVPEGGGPPTAVEIIDGNSNTIFNDISELDRAGGRVSLRKLFASVQTPTVDGYYGANVIVAEPPEDPRVSVTLFSTESTFDRRTDAKSRIEAYLAPGSEFAGFLFENHIAGQRSIQIFQRTTDQPPTVGITILMVQNEGLSTQKLQYVRVTRVSIVERTFTYGGDRDYQAHIVTCDISDPLRTDFTGSPPSRDFRRATSATMLRETIVADAAVYYGVVPLVEPVSVGQLACKVQGIFTQLVPSAQTEIPIVDVDLAGRLNTPVESANGFVTFTTTILLTNQSRLYIGVPIFPGSLSISYSGGALTDNGGNLFNGAVIVGTVDYENGEVLFSDTSPSFTGTKTVTYRPTVFPAAVSDSIGVEVTIESRAFNYIRFINPIPAPRTLSVSYRAQGKWYTLRDNGAGVLSGGDSAYGSGTISYSTGLCAVTLGALPDVGSTVIFTFGTKTQYINRSALVPQKPTYKFTLENEGVAPGTVEITWNDGTARTASDNGTGGIVGSATGSIDYGTGEIEISPNSMVAPGQEFTVTYDYGPPESQSFSHPWAPSGISTTAVTLQLNNGGPVIPGSVNIRFFVRSRVAPGASWDYRPVTPGRLVMAYDNGSGAIISKLDGSSLGTINYTSGVIEMDPKATVIGTVRTGSTFHPDAGIAILTTGYWTHQYGPGEVTLFANTTSGVPQNEGYQPITVTYQTSSGSPTSDQFTAPSTLTVDLTPTMSEPIVPGSINFTLGGRRYFDRLGRIFYGLDPQNGSATEAGSVNYTSGEVQLSSWVPGQPATVALTSLLTSMELRPISKVSFRIPASPVRPGSFQLIGTFVGENTPISATADTNGNITGTNVIGKIDYESGVVNIAFGQYVPAAGNESEEFYDPAAVVDGQIFRPAPVIGNTLRFNAVAFAYLPLDADILGLDPVRLPQDGRVPIFRPGTFAVIGNTGTIGPVIVSNGQTINCGRVRLSRVRILDANNDVLNTGYTADLELGTVTINDVTGWVQPVKIEHRIEDMMLVSDAQISGDLAFTRQITHNYPVNGSYVSSALVAGDLSARVNLSFDQATWNGTWSDVISGAAATGTYNTVLAPIEVTNAGALTERWAIRFTGVTTFEVIGENVGVIATGNTGADCSPLNPATMHPYFTIRAIGWGQGWAVGNVLRFNTVGANFPIWVVRTVQQGPETAFEDSFTVLVRGDVDRP